jgi:hypothetical protein
VACGLLATVPGRSVGAAEIPSDQRQAIEGIIHEGPTLPRFLSEDPNFIQGGPENWQNSESADPQYAALQGFVKSGNSVNLANPQNLNPCSYVDENPLKYTDPAGKNPLKFAIGILGGIQGDISLYQERQTQAEANGVPYNIWEDNGGDYGRAFGAEAIGAITQLLSGDSITAGSAAQFGTLTFGEQIETGRTNVVKNLEDTAEDAAIKKLLGISGLELDERVPLPSGSFGGGFSSPYFGHQILDTGLESLVSGILRQPAQTIYVKSSGGSAPTSVPSPRGLPSPPPPPPIVCLRR